MNPGDLHRISKRHLDRRAIVYVRQSDPQQVRDNTESTALQRGLRERAIELGWSSPRLVEDDLGISASGFADRPGFQWMLTQVTMRKVGIIMCIEASRLSRNSADWARLFELCGYFDTLVADPQQVYDVSVPNDRLVLQIKGTVAELELGSLRIRLRAGIEAKAARGELKVLLPPGYVYDAEERIVLDPDGRVQQAIRYMFEQFEQHTSIRQLALSYRASQTLFPVRKPRNRGTLVWELPKSAMLHGLVRHPIYAGVYAWGRTETVIDCDGGRLVKRSRRKEYQADVKPLGRLVVAHSYRSRTKTKRPRIMPVHATLAVVLDDWRDEGWEKMMGRAPNPDDLIVPRPPHHVARQKSRKSSSGMRDKNYSRRRMVDDLKALGMRHRRGHDLRRSFITLARQDGARPDLLEMVTHAPRGNIMNILHVDALGGPVRRGGEAEGGSPSEGRVGGHAEGRRGGPGAGLAYYRAYYNPYYSPGGRGWKWWGYKGKAGDPAGGGAGSRRQHSRGSFRYVWRRFAPF